MKRPAFGHILGYTALTVILTAGAAQSLAGTNTVDSGDIVDRSITTPDLKDGALSGSKVLDNSITGADVNESSLTLTCPTAMTRLGDICYGPQRASDTLSNAQTDCADESLRLPSFSEAAMIVSSIVTDQIWTDIHYHADNEYAGVTEGDSAVSYRLPTNLVPYRCVTSVGARP